MRVCVCVCMCVHVCDNITCIGVTASHLRDLIYIALRAYSQTAFISPHNLCAETPTLIGTVRYGWYPPLDTTTFEVKVQ